MTFGWTYTKGLSFADMGIYSLLGNFGTYDATTNSFQRCRPARATMARIGGCSVDVVKRALARLVKAGLIERHERYAGDGTQLPSEYTIRCGEFRAPSMPSMSQFVEGGTSAPLTKGTKYNANEPQNASTSTVSDIDQFVEGGIFAPGRGAAEHQDPYSVNQENPPRSLTTVTSPCEKRDESQKRGDIISKKSKADNQDVVQTILNMPGIRANMSRFGEARLRVVVEACQQRGITDQQMISAVGDRSFDGVRYLERALSARLEALEVRTPDVDTKVERCRLHGHSDALHCPSCWGVVKAGNDPYEGCEDQRPKGWHMVYAWSPSVKIVTMDETQIEPLNLSAAITAMLA